ncbi:unnamed protein product, partial [Didymodactylos carnosus]
NKVQLEFCVNNDIRTITNVTIIILDENDCEPRFEQNNYEIKLTENNLYPKFVLRFTANDPDEGDNGQIKYDMTLIEINHKNSVDQGQLISLRSCTTLIILVLDLNDNIPLFPSSILNIEIYENLEQNDYITQIQAKDADQDENGTITYKFQNKTILIDINSFDGRITATSEF